MIRIKVDDAPATWLEFKDGTSEEYIAKRVAKYKKTKDDELKSIIEGCKKDLGTKVAKSNHQYKKMRALLEVNISDASGGKIFY